MISWKEVWEKNGFHAAKFGLFSEQFRDFKFQLFGGTNCETFVISQCREVKAENDFVQLEIVGDYPENRVSARYELTLDRRHGAVYCSGELTGGQGGSKQKIKGPFSLCVSFGVPDADNIRMSTIGGGHSTMQDYPPQAYSYRECDNVYSLVSNLNGFSTDQLLPYTIIRDPDRQCGVVSVMEWCGNWILYANMARHDDDSGIVSLFWHQRSSSFYLKEGEKAYIPAVHFLFFKGDADAGANALRRYYVDRMRTVSETPVFYNHFFYYGNNFDEEILKKDVDFYAAAGCEYFVVDGGWHKGEFRNGIGNWDTPHEKKFPSGMRAFSDYVHEHGMKFGLWFEPEFAMIDSDWCREYPQYYMSAKERVDKRTACSKYQEKLFRMDLPEARAFIVQRMSKLIRDWNVDWVRLDFNNAPGAFWEANDAEDQVGLMENHYCAGVYQFLDMLKAENPGLHIESCAGGGHRMDFGILRRSDSAWMSDLAVPHDNVRRFQINLNRYVPGMANSVFITRKPHPEDGILSFGGSNHKWSELLSKFAGPCGMSERSANFSAEGMKQLQDYIALYKEYRHYLLKDFYPLCEPGSSREWDGWQFHDPVTGSGIAAFFRCRSVENTFSSFLHGLDPDRDYEVRAISGDAGNVVLSGGKITLSLNNTHDSVLIHYKIN